MRDIVAISDKRLWKAQQHVLNLFAAQDGSVWSRAKDGETGNGIGDNPDAV